MTELSDELRRTDPVAREGGLTSLEVSQLRAAVLAEVPSSQPVGWAAFAVAAVVLLATVASGGWLVRSQRPDAAPVAAGVRTPHVGLAGGERRQLLLETPGGTRIIWTFNESFQLR